MASTPEATKSQAESREGFRHGTPRPAATVAWEAPDAYVLGRGVTRAERIKPYERSRSDPVYRPLGVFTRDPATSVLAGAIAVINLPYELLLPGPEGALFKVVGTADNPRGGLLDLNEPNLLLSSGVAPTMSDSRFRQQMVYAVCASVYASFRAALGRYVAWGFDAPGTGPLKLTIRPDSFEGENAYYEKHSGSLSFGTYYGVKTRTVGNNLPGGRFYTALSHDVVAHEVTHALLDGLRANFTIPSGPDVPAFHEAFADLVAFFQRFTYTEVVRAAIRESDGNLAKSAALTNIAEQFAQTTSGGGALRTIVELQRSCERLRQYGEDLEPHRRGSVLTAAVFDAFNTIYRRKTAVYLRLATNGTGVLPPGQIPVDLEERLAKAASDLANQFLSMLIRAIDYCPPVDIYFGDFLRALITADRDLVPDDRYAYREALIDAFRRRAILPFNVENLSEDELLWRTPRKQIDPIAGLNFANLRFRGDPQNAADAAQLTRQARFLGDVICRPQLASEFGLVSQADAARCKLRVGRPVIQSIRSSRRIGPDGQIAFDLVAEVTQIQILYSHRREIPFFGGSTVILDPEGKIRYVISKSIVSSSRIADQKAFVEASAGQAFWEPTRTGMQPKPEMLRQVHG